MNTQFAVIGLGRFGVALCEELNAHGVEVLAIDVDEDRLRLVIDMVSHVVLSDASDEEAVSELELERFDVVFVAIGDDINASILTTLVLKEAGIENVWVKAKNRFHAKILEKIGADKIVSPERDMGVKIARKMIDSRVNEFLELGADMALAEFSITDVNAGKTIADLELMVEQGVQLLAHKRDEFVHSQPDVETLLLAGDELILVANKHVLDLQLKAL
ncbi:trk system potassium uptake protein TrkA [Sinobacterium caligoides]|uniref:Trk system potassium uptake protein TrkA n=1 Tax=Sinobacterium caligoides TaxID=933926 RepID=A0A3N2DZ89_9GAMM|nr:TrkA family potassium uptake protein [Sinobacterium caligoides]ROS05196.1 trk system potassium uptake protein TrkA [Sinobacterium caligoides]